MDRRHFRRIGPSLLLALFLGFAVALPGCLSDGAAVARAHVQRTPAYQFEQYDFDATRPLYRRVGPVPQHVLNYVRELDERPDYRSYQPNAAERRLIRRSLDRLPPRIKRNLMQRGLGIYFVDDFLTSALTDWAVAGADGKVYSYMIFHASSLRTSMEDLLNRREISCFREDGSGMEIKIQVAGGENAFMYLLLHEAVHALDYSERISPFVETTVQSYQSKFPRDNRTGALLDRVWSDYGQPRDRYDFAGRDRLSFYGFRNGPLLDMAEAPAIYRGLAGSPFVSLYGSQIWPEDLAELVSMYYLTAAAGRDYSIRLSLKGETIAEYRPLEFPAVQKRIKNLKQYFD